MLMTFEDGTRIASALADAELESQCKGGAARLRQYVPSPEGSKQAAALLALSGLSDAKVMNEQVLAKNGVQGVSTFYGYYMLEAMAKAGDVQRGIDTVRDYWGGMLDMGATSFWEDFDRRAGPRTPFASMNCRSRGRGTFTATSENSATRDSVTASAMDGRRGRRHG